MELHAKFTLLAEAARGSPDQDASSASSLDGAQPQTYGLGIKELWEVEPAKHEPGKVIHTIGWPWTATPTAAPGSTSATTWSRSASSSARLREPVALAVRGVPALEEPPGDPADARGRRRIAYGRARSTRRLPVDPELAFPGGALIGDTAGFLNVPKIKGTRTGDEVRHAGGRGRVRGDRKAGREKAELDAYRALKASWLWDELTGCATSGRASSWAVAGIAYAGAGHLRAARQGAWTLGHQADHESLPASECPQRSPTPSPTACSPSTRLSSVFLSQHQPRGGPAVPPAAQGPDAAGAGQPAGLRRPEQRYCPAGGLRVRAARRGRSACRSTRRTASTARPATSRTRRRTSTGSRPRAAAGRTISAGCDEQPVDRRPPTKRCASPARDGRLRPSWGAGASRLLVH